jgi:UDP-arabinose 4-epimerase
MEKTAVAAQRRMPSHCYIERRISAHGWSDPHFGEHALRILVTGGAGYIGSHTAKLLERTGLDPVVFDNLSEGHRWAARWGPLVEGDLADGALLRQTISRFEIGAVIHFAASAYVGESVGNPRKYFQNNVVRTLSLLDTMVDMKVSSIVFSSTCATYGDPIHIPIAEDHPQAPVNPYGESKLFVEKALKWYSQAYGLRYASLRYFNAAGADPEGEIGEDHNTETHLIPLAILAAMGKVRQLQVFGTDYPTSDGTAIRDYIHVDDLANAHLKALAALQQGSPSMCLNLGTGRGHTVLEVVRAVEEVSGLKVPLQLAGRRGGDPPALVAEARRANEELSWSPRYTDLRELTATAWRWHQRHHGRP